MENIGEILDGIAALAWPFLILLLLVMFSGSIKEVIDSARRRKFSIKVGDNELTMEESTEQQRLLINDLQEQVISLKQRVEQTDETVLRSAAAPANVDDKLLKKILWVDDYPSNNANIIAHLSDLGVDVTTAKSTQEGMQRFGSGHYDAVLSDMGRFEDGRNNHKAGIDLAKQIREIDPDVPFYIFCSRRGKTRGEKEAREAGANGVTTSFIQLLNWLGQVGKLGGL